MNNEQTVLSPASMLEGLVLEGNWRVVSAVEDFDGKSGGFFSFGYIVERDGKQAFLKAFDYLLALQSPNPAEAIKPLVDMYEFEKVLHNECLKMNRVVRILGYGSVKIPNQHPAASVVQYLIFELADGDLNWALGNFDSISVSQVLTMAKHAAVGLWQLHRAGIAHQDLKPSNLMVFETGRHSAKVGDLGCASQKGFKTPRSLQKVAGDRRYAPPERLYGFEYGGEWNVGRVAGDMYHLGSLIFSMFAGSPLTATIIEQLPREKHPMVWRGDYEEIKPDLVSHFDYLLERLSQSLPDSVKPQLPIVIRELANPDIRYRGNIKNPQRQFSFEPYISKLDRLSKLAQIKFERNG